MSAAEDVDELIHQYHLASDEFLKGNPEPALRLFSRRDDVTLANPLSPPVRGWEQVAEVSERAASQFRDGEMVGFETIEKHVTPELAYRIKALQMLRISSSRSIRAVTYQLFAKVGGQQKAVPVAAVHDEILVECDEDEAEKVVAWLEKAMIDGMDEVLNDPEVEGPRVPVEVETKVVKSWAA